MDVFLRIDINLFTTFFLAIVVFLAYHRLDRKDSFNRLFFAGSIVIMLMTLFEAVTCMLNPNPAAWARWTSTILHLCLFAFAPLISYFWFLLADTLSLHGNLREIKIKWIYLAPVLGVLVLDLLTPFFRWIFYIDELGVYHRGPLFIVDLIVTYSYMVLGFGITIKRRKNMVRLDAMFLVLIYLMPMIGGLVQGLVYGTLFIWASSACALIIMYLYLQERMVQIDHQTGAWTRHSFEYNVTQKLLVNDDKPFGVAYVDIDNLKYINDHFGHREGDEAIRTTVQIIDGVLRKGDEIARLGGDEFAVLLDLDTLEALNNVLKRIHGAFDVYNRQSHKPYKLSLSLGADLFRDSMDLTIEEIIGRVDHLMYENKREKKMMREQEQLRESGLQEEA